MGQLAETASRLETKFLPVDPAAASVDGLIEGYASLFGRVDGGGDEVAPGAFATSLAKRGGPIKMLWQHDPNQPIGVWDDVREDGLGLRVGGRIVTEVRAGAEALALMRAGAVDGLSIGYRTVRSARTKEGGRRLLEIELWEISLVTFPMLEAARARPASPGASKESLRDLAAALDEARQLFA
jgi:HK97 family phage prohead protease